MRHSVLCCVVLFVRCRIQGKEESILQYEEDAEVFKDRNCRQKEKVSSRSHVDGVIIIICLRSFAEVGGADNLYITRLH